MFSVRGARLFLSGLLAAMAVILLAFVHPAWRPWFDAAVVPAGAYVAVAFWALAVPMWLRTLWRAPLAANAVAGVAVLLPLFIALLALRDRSPWLLLSFAIIVWVADVAAYFAGKGFGKRKLAPAISPGKTIEGVLGGLVAVVGYFFAWRALAQAWPAEWSAPWVAAGMSVLLIFITLGLASVLGDLFESWIKRGAGMKDSGTLLPGHGGVLDRIDALTSALPLAMAYVVLSGLR